MSTLIGGPLNATCDAQIPLTKSTAEFINNVGFDENNNRRTIEFSFGSSVTKDNECSETEWTKLDVPKLLIVPIPCLQIEEQNVLFDMEVHKEVKGEEKSIAAIIGVNSKFGLKVSVSGNDSSTNTDRMLENSAKYHVHINSKNDNVPENLANLLNMMAEKVSTDDINKIE